MYHGTIKHLIIPTAKYYDSVWDGMMSQLWPCVVEWNCSNGVLLYLLLSYIILFLLLASSDYIHFFFLNCRNFYADFYHPSKAKDHKHGYYGMWNIKKRSNAEIAALVISFILLGSTGYVVTFMWVLLASRHGFNSIPGLEFMGNSRIDGQLRNWNCFIIYFFLK